MNVLRPDDQLVIERLGGLAGLGLPGSRIRSRAVLEVRTLDPEECHCLSGLFAAPGAAQSDTGPDAFRYRLTLHRRSSSQCIEVREDALLASLQDRVQDELI